MNPEQLAQMQHSQNPLQRFMRQPSIYIKLPSNGVFWAQGAIEMPVNGEIPILPMSTTDEITLNTPDALMNGVGVVDMIHSCCPNIKNAWEIPVTDLDMILIAIRIASYGEKMEYTSTCPKCENKDEYEIDLRLFMDQKIDMNLYNEPFEYKGMQVYVRPMNFQSINQQNLETFEQQRLVVMINDSEISAEEKQRRFAEIFSKMTEYTIMNVTGSIRKIVTPEGVEVYDPDMLFDFVKNSERQFYDSLKKHMKKIQDSIPAKQVTTTCDECKHPYDTPFTFDQSNFFAFAS
jgi:RNase P subunit RPR2